MCYFAMWNRKNENTDKSKDSHCSQNSNCVVTGTVVVAGITFWNSIHLEELSSINWHVRIVVFLCTKKIEVYGSDLPCTKNIG